MAETVFGLIDRFLVDRMNEIADALASGKAQDWAHYRYLAGHVQALNEVRIRLAELLKEADDAD